MAVRHHVRILVVDHDPAARDTIQKALQTHDYNVQCAAGAPQAIDAAARIPFDVAILALDLPDTDPADLVRRLRELNENIALITTADRPDIESAAYAMRLGSRDYLVKPVSPERLLDSVEMLCREKGLIYQSEEELNRLIGGRIRAERLAQNLTLRELSERTSLTTSQLSQVELGKNAASIWALARISAALGKRLSELLAGV